MKFFLNLIIILTLITFNMNAQEDKLPFNEIGDYPNEYSETNIVSRMIDGLGYRYYWATESLSENDLNYKPSDDSRSTFELVEHIYNLSIAIVKTFEGQEFDFTHDKHNFEEYRTKTLENLQTVKDYLKQTDDLSKLKIVLVQGEKVLKDGDINSIAFSLHANSPGALLKTLSCIASFGLNMSRIESRPSKRELGEYVFFVDISQIFLEAISNSWELRCKTHKKLQCRIFRKSFTMIFMACVCL